MNVRQAAVLLGLVFVIVLAVAVAKQLSTEAMAVVIGVVCGVAAGLPTSVLLLVALTRRDRRRLDEMERRSGSGMAGYPPVVVVQGSASPALPYGQQGLAWPAAPPVAAERKFTVVGEDLWDEEIL